MNTAVSTPARKNLLITPLIISLLVTLFLFFIDEGYYNFKWMLDAGNWFAFVIYTILLLTGQLLVILLLRKSAGPLLTIAKYILGVALGITFAFLLFGN